ncbi:hypothetical protein QE364_002876 [Nocardioides zeae]|uniref:Uncharacterized protein n=2 Tax=Nocardioides zeae TaxID=1457234 RepID=A0ACC6IKN5_9ACTN|nr:hypothetical protein [Nocardioides zeae]MDQ1104932.1 hypothetical protein [Nocardioides zeae]MDR6175353.1 hypothetical protein [Nocardioides zeae]MDR6211155.1 hypothetical protein [Nocardioides zeae]
MITTTRRRVLATAAWTAPAVAVVSAAPAFAVSTANGTLTINRGASRFGAPPNEYGDAGARSVLFNGFSITPSKTSPALLTLTVTNSQNAIASYDYVPAAPSGWSRTSGPDANPVTYVSSGALTAGTAVPFGPTGSEGYYFDDNVVRGVYTITASAPGFDSQAVSFGPP